MKYLYVFAACLIPALALGSDLTFESAKAKADSDEAALSAEQQAALVSSQGQIAHSTFANCPASDLPDKRLPFTIVVELDATGKVLRTWLSGTSAVATCLDKAMRAGSLFHPPKSPFYSSFEYTFQNQ
jgi:hypothetical protein